MGTNTLEQVRQQNLELKYKLLTTQPVNTGLPKDLDDDNWCGGSFGTQEFQAGLDWEAFKLAHPELEADQCREMLTAFLKANDLPLSLKNLGWAHDYLSAAGLITELPEPQVEPKPVFKDTIVREPYRDNIPGFDERGNPRVYDSHQVEAMSSSEYEVKILGLVRRAERR